MFRAEIHQLANGPTLTMEGRLVGDWAEQARSLVTKASVPQGLIVDLTEVSYVDAVGEQVLIWFRSVGAAFVANAIYAADVCERLQLPLQGKRDSRFGEGHRGGVRGPSPGQTRAG